MHTHKLGYSHLLYYNAAKNITQHLVQAYLLQIQQSLE